MSNLKIKTPEWAEPLLQPCRYKGAKGGRGGGRSHFFAELAIEAMVLDPNISIVCIREIQRSLKFSAKKLIEDKIRQYKLQDYFEITQTEIRSKKGAGLMIFQGMQNHTNDSIKSLEDFKYAWVEEANTLSKRSLQLLRPTIRSEGSELWFSWNPDQPTDPVDEFFQKDSDDKICIHHNSNDNPFLPDTLKKERENDRFRMSPEDFNHIWLGDYNNKSEALIFKNKYDIDYFEPDESWTRLQGLDFGFSQDPTAGTVNYVNDNNLYIRNDFLKVGLELDDSTKYILSKIPDYSKYVIRADNARPESISYLKRKGLPLIKGEAKLKIEDGIEHMKQYDKIIIHPHCKETIKEFGLYSYKVDKRSGDILPTIEDKHNHCFTGDTLITTIKGQKPIEKIKKGDFVLTSEGYKRVLKKHNNGIKEIIETLIKFDTFTLSLKSTKDHKIKTQRGWIQINQLTSRDKVYLHNHIMANYTENIKEKSTSVGVVKGCIGSFGRILKERYLKVMIYTIRIMIQVTMIFQTLIWLIQDCIVNILQKNITRKTQNGQKNLIKKEEKQVKNGMHLKRVENGTLNMLKKFLENVNQKNIIAYNAVKYMKPKHLAKTSIVQTDVNLNIEERKDLMTSLDNAKNAKKNIKLTNIQKVKRAQGSAQEVYDLTVKETHEYFANGVLVHNCIDSIRYALFPLIKKKNDLLFVNM